MPNDPPIRVAGNVIGVPFTLKSNAGTTLLSLSDAGALSLGSVGGTLGFYGVAGVALQTGVAVDAAGIHAALVALNLITA